MDDQDSLVESLTEIEEQVLALLERGGMNIQEIATTLDITPDEVAPTYKAVSRSFRA